MEVAIDTLIHERFCFELNKKAPDGLLSSMGLVGRGLESKLINLMGYYGVETSKDVKSEVCSAACRDI